MTKLLLIVSVFISTLVQGQQFTTLSQYMLNSAYLNPAYSGTGELTNFTFLHRTQWAGYSDYQGQSVASQMQLLTGIVNIDKTGHTIGLIAGRDKIAYSTDFLLQASYAYRVQLSQLSSLSFGARLGIDSRSIDFTKYVLKDGDDPDAPQGKQSETHPDVTLGMWYNHERYYLGASAKSLIKPGSDTPGFNNEPAYVFTGGLHLPLSRDLKITPSAQFITSAGDFSLDVSALASYGDVLWGGLSYRHEEAATAIAGIALLDKKLRLSYAFDYTINNKEVTAATSHEIMISLVSGKLTGKKRTVTLKRSKVKVPKQIYIVKDKDKDGIPDDEDKCIDEPGVKKFDGCPDRDNDGIQDSEDQCPDVPGIKAFEGCPDTDNDGIPDSEDACVNEAGPKELNGCPDTDKDGVADREDECPGIPGSAEHKGCPVSFSEENLAHITFETGKATLQTTSYVALDEVIVVLKQYPNTRIIIEGHTDNEGDDNANMELSRQRAETIRLYFAQKGIKAERISTKGYGETKPIDTNDTPEGRRRNRRVEIHFIKETRNK